MIDQKLLSILCCPETKQDLTLLDDRVVKEVNRKIEAGEVKNRAGEVVKERIDAGLLREDRAYFYPIREDIPIMLIDEAIAFDDFA